MIANHQGLYDLTDEEIQYVGEKLFKPAFSRFFTETVGY